MTPGEVDELERLLREATAALETLVVLVAMDDAAQATRLEAPVKHALLATSRLLEGREGWLPIESAPDQTFVLISDPTFGVCEAIRHGCGLWRSYGANGAVRCAPTHWQRKPPPPPTQEDADR